jgi:hypothetical protein
MGARLNLAGINGSWIWAIRSGKTSRDGSRSKLHSAERRQKDRTTGQGEGQDWRGEFTGMEYKQLNTSEKIVWLKKEEVRIREMQGEKQLNCGKAYIAKEEAYVAYEKHGGYGGADWKRYVRSYGKRS